MDVTSIDNYITEEKWATINLNDVFISLCFWPQPVVLRVYFLILCSGIK